MPMDTLADNTAHYGRQNTFGIAPDFMAS